MNGLNPYYEPIARAMHEERIRRAGELRIVREARNRRDIDLTFRSQITRAIQRVRTRFQPAPAGEQAPIG